MHLYRLKRVKKEILSTITKFNNLGRFYEVLGGTTIQQCTCKHSTK